MLSGPNITASVSVTVNKMPNTLFFPTIQETMDAFSSKDMAMKAQKKILSTMATKSSVQMFIDDTTSEILDELYRVSKEYSGNKSEAQKVIKNLIKIAVKIGVLFRNNRFNAEEMGVAQEFKKKLHTGAMTAISFYEVRFNTGYVQGLETQILDFITSCIKESEANITIFSL